jgi:hypothetical protein
MSFNQANLAFHIQGSGSSPTVFNYSTGDNLSDVENIFYWSDVRFFRNYDIIRVTANDGKALYYTAGADHTGPTMNVIKIASDVNSF